MRVLMLVSVILLLASQTGTFAQSTPNHVFQKTEEIRLVLLRLNEANFSKPPNSKPQVDQAMPRHVLQLARDVWRKTQLLRFMNGLPTVALPPIPAREITPADVMETVQSIYQQVSDLLPAYELQELEMDVRLPSDKTPTDVFRNLVRLSESIDTMGVPATVPNDVEQMAQSVLFDVSLLADHIGIDSFEEIVGKVSPQSGKVPADALNEAIALAGDLSRMVQSNDSLDVKGGIIVPSRKTQSVTPADVILVLSRTRADVNAIRIAAKDKRFSENAPYVGGQTPSDVVTSVMKSRAIISTLSTSQDF